MLILLSFFFFFFNDTATTEIYTLSLHDALPIFTSPGILTTRVCGVGISPNASAYVVKILRRSEEHTSELQSLRHLVCRLLLEKKKEDTDRETSSTTYATRSMLPATMMLRAHELL